MMKNVALGILISMALSSFSSSSSSSSFTSSCYTHAFKVPKRTDLARMKMIGHHEEQSRDHQRMYGSSSSSSSGVLSKEQEGTRFDVGDNNERAEPSDMNPRSTGLALQLDDGTRKSHSMAQNSAFVTGFFKGISTRAAYRQLLTSLYYVYKAMEEDVLDLLEQEEKGRESMVTDGSNAESKRQQYASMIRSMDDPSLRRLKQLEKDMVFFYGQDQNNDSDVDGDGSVSLGTSIDSINIPPPTPATQRYVNRIRELVASSSSSKDNRESKLYLFIAHQYTRYLGDLFGGQMMGKMAVSSLDLPPISNSDGGSSWGVQFYTFDDIQNTNQYITGWYERLNCLDLTSSQKEEIVDEANLVFDFNIDLLQELEQYVGNGSALTTILKLGFKSLTEQVGSWKKDETTNGKFLYTFNTK